MVLKACIDVSLTTGCCIETSCGVVGLSPVSYELSGWLVLCLGVLCFSEPSTLLRVHMLSTQSAPSRCLQPVITAWIYMCVSSKALMHACRNLLEPCCALTSVCHQLKEQTMLWSATAMFCMCACFWLGLKGAIGVEWDPDNAS
jgi:hypothetical protein